MLFGLGKVRELGFLGWVCLSLLVRGSLGHVERESSELLWLRAPSPWATEAFSGLLDSHEWGSSVGGVASLESNSVSSGRHITSL